MDEQQAAEVYDVVIAGAGVAGVLAAVRLSEAFPEARILLAEKSSQVGGRLRTSHAVAGEWNSGLAAVSQELFDYIGNSLRANPEGKDLPELIPYRQEQLGLLSGSQLERIHVEELFTPAGAKAVGGNTAAREWEKLEELWATPSVGADVPFSKAWKHPKKNPATIVLSQFANLCGIPDIWASHAGSLWERAQFIRRGLYFGPWEDVLAALLNGRHDGLQVKTSCQVLEAKLANDLWQIETEQGAVVARSLIVAQPPWQANDWLDRQACPVPVLNLALKAKPTSAVFLTEILEGDAPAELPDLTLISSEDVFVLRPHDGSLCFHTVIDFELSLDAPTVVKAIKRLRRASKKLKKALPNLQCTGEYLALRAVAWAQSPSYSDRKNWERLADPAKFQHGQLAFCGDAYGNSYKPDENLVKSLTSACTLVGAYLEKKGE